MLSKEAIEEYKKIYKNRFGVDLNDDEAAFRANNLVNLYKAVYEQTSFDGVQRRDVEGIRDGLS